MLGNRSMVLLWSSLALLCSLLSPLAEALLASSSQLPLQKFTPEAKGEARSQKPYGLSSAACRVAHRCKVTAVEAAAWANETASHPIWLRPNTAAEPRGCSCKSGCELFGACCVDMVDRNADRVRRKRMPRNSYSCSAWLGKATGDECDPLGSGLTVVHRCPAVPGERLKPIFSLASLREKCAFPMNASSKRTDELATPVTDRETGATYRNVHCASCWNVSQRELVLWQWKLSCKEVHSRNHRLLPALQHANQSAAFALAEQQWLQDFALFLRHSCKLQLDPPPGVLNRLHRCQPELVDDCHLDDNPATNRSVVDAAARACAREATAIVYSQQKSDGRSVAYRNINCSRCQALATGASYEDGDDDMTCAPKATLSGSWPCDGASRVVLSYSFTVLLSRSGNSDVADDLCLSESLWSSMYGTSSTDREQCARVARCVLGDAATPNDSTLCSFLCQTPDEHYVQAERRCLPTNNATRSCSYFSRWPEAGSIAAVHLPSAKTAALRTRLDADHDEGGGGGTIVVPINDTLSVCFRCKLRLSFLVYELLDDGVLRANGSTYAPPLYVVDTERGVATVCVPREQNDAISGAMQTSVDGGDCEALPGWVTTAILTTSIACLLLYLILFAFWRRLRHFPGDLVANEACAFLAGFTLFLLRPLAAASAIGCHVLAVGIHYLLVAAFAWMMLYAIEVVRALSLSVVRLTDATSEATRRRRLVYYAIGWCSPLAVVGSALLADKLGALVRPAYGSPQCFLNSLRGNRAFFVAPLCAVTLVVVGVYGYMTIRLVVIARQTHVAKRRGADTEKLMLAVKLLFALGPLWLLAVLSSFIDSPPIACTFVVLNASQGIFLLAAYACNTEARRQVLRCWSRFVRSCGHERRRLPIRSTSSASRSYGEPVSTIHGEGTTQTSLVTANN